MNKRKLSIAGAIGGIIILGFYREFVFVNINEQLFALWYEEESRASKWIPFIHSVDYYPLYYAKWVLTVLFAGLFYWVTGLILRLIFQKSFWKVLLAIYSVLFIGAGLALGIGYLIDAFERSYIIARFLMGIAQSPLILMIMIPGIWLRGARAIER